LFFFSFLIDFVCFLVSYLDDQLKQEIPLKTCRTLTNLQQDNLQNIIVTNKDNIYILEPLSLDEQIEQLLNSYRLQEALTLAESSCTTTKQRQTSAIVKSTKKRIGLIEFGAMNVVRALTLFDEVQIDFHELIGQISGFSPLTSPWNDIDETLKHQYNQWLNAFCDYMIKHSLEFSRQSVIKKCKFYFQRKQNRLFLSGLLSIFVKSLCVS